MVTARINVNPVDDVAVAIHEYVLKAIGWVRVVFGTQSLLSVYLLAMWALTYFGRPFFQ